MTDTSLPDAIMASRAVSGSPTVSTIRSGAPIHLRGGYENATRLPHRITMGGAVSSIAKAAVLLLFTLDPSTTTN